MNKKDLIRLRTKIVAKLADLEMTTANASAAMMESAEAIPSVLQDESDSAKGELDLENAARVQKHSAEQQRHLRNAIIRMERGSYGQCQTCDEDIGMRRLEAVPGATLCIHCQEERELGALSDTRPSHRFNQIQIRWAA